MIPDKVGASAGGTGCEWSAVSLWEAHRRRLQLHQWVTSVQRPPAGGKGNLFGICRNVPAVCFLPFCESVGASTDVLSCAVSFLGANRRWFCSKLVKSHLLLTKHHICTYSYFWVFSQNFHSLRILDNLLLKLFPYTRIYRSLQGVGLPSVTHKQIELTKMNYKQNNAIFYTFTSVTI